MGEGTIRGRLILDVKKKKNGSNVDLDEAKLSFLVGRIPDERDGLAGKIVMDLRSIKILNTQQSRVDGPDCCNSISSDTTNQAIQKDVKLENLVRSIRDVRPLGNRTSVGRCRRNVHAISN
jgi:hypothetical protein